MERKKIKNFFQSQSKDGTEVYTTKQVMQLFGIKPSRFRQWLRLGYIKPYRKAKASGSNHYFIKEDLYSIGLFINFINLGLNRWIASEWSRFDYPAWTENIAPQKEFYLVVNGDTSSRPDKKWKSNLECRVYQGSSPNVKNERAVIILNLKKILTEIDAIIG